MAKLRILIVENHPFVRLAIERVLTEIGHEPVGWAATVPNAIAEAERLRPDLVIMDIHLDDQGDGTHAARIIREQLDIPSLFLTGGADPEKRQRAMATRPVGYLQKPFLPQELAAALVNVAPLQGPVILATTLDAVEAAVQMLSAAPAAKPEPAAANEPQLKKPERGSA